MYREMWLRLEPCCVASTRQACGRLTEALEMSAARRCTAGHLAKGDAPATGAKRSYGCIKVRQKAAASKEVETSECMEFPVPDVPFHTMKRRGCSRDSHHGYGGGGPHLASSIKMKKWGVFVCVWRLARCTLRWSGTQNSARESTHPQSSSPLGQTGKSTIRINGSIHEKEKESTKLDCHKLPYSAPVVFPAPIL